MKRSTMSNPIPVKSTPGSNTFSLLCNRVPLAEKQSLYKAQWILGILLAAMGMPMPVLQMTMPFLHSPDATAWATTLP